jgi:hypothetical protein
MPTKTPAKPRKETEAPNPEDALAIPLDNTPAAIIERRVKLTDTSMVIADDTTFEESVSLYDFIDKIRERGRWWLGDLVNFMEGKFPDKYTQAIELTGLTYSRLTTIVSVCARIDPSRRRKELSFSMHEMCAYIPCQTADHLLDRAIKEKWTPEQLSDAVARSKGEPTKAEKKAAKEALKVNASKQLPEKANGAPPTLDGHLTLELKQGEKPIIWNGYPLSTSGRVILQGTEVLDAAEADRAAHNHKFPHAEALVNWLEEHNFRKEGETPCATPKLPSSATVEDGKPDTTANAAQSVASNGASVVQPDAAPKSPDPASPAPASTAPEPIAAPTQPNATVEATAPTLSIEDIAEGCLKTFALTCKEVKWGDMGPLAAKRWLKLMVPVDEVIDILSKRIK